MSDIEGPTRVRSRSHSSGAPKSTRRSGRRWPAFCVAFGVIAPIVCFSVFLSVGVASTATWPCALFVATCVAAMATSIWRESRGDALDAAVDGALLSATMFASPFALILIPFTIIAIVLALGHPSDFAFAALGASAPLGWFAYARQFSRRCTRHRAMRAQIGVAYGFIGPGIVCLALWGALAISLERDRYRVLHAPGEIEVTHLLTWRVFAPGADWSELHDACLRDGASDELRAYWNDAYFAATGWHAAPRDEWD